MFKIFNKNKSTSSFLGVFSFFLSPTILLIANTSKASTSLLVSGHAGVVGQATFGTPPVNSDYSSIRVPIGLILEARPTDNFSLYFGLDYAYNNYPGPSTLLGQNSASLNQSNSKGNSIGTYSFLPFSNSIAGTPYSQNTDFPSLTQAYFSYQTAIGLLSAGRMPRHWGLGIWKNADWTVFGGLPTTIDSVSLYTDFNAFDMSFYYEKYGEGLGGTSKDGEANAFTVEARLKSDLADVASSGVGQEVGVSFTKFSHNLSNTTMNILDVYSKFYVSKFYLGAEVLYPSGSTQSPNYRSLGGAAACPSSTDDSPEGSRTCVVQDIDGALAALLKMKLQISGDSSSSIASLEKAQRVLGTYERTDSHVIGLWAGYASGGGNQFLSANQIESDNNIKAIAMNYSIQPSFLMFNNTMPAVNGMPGGAITNTTFVRLDYTYENSSFGSVGPVLVWGMLNANNPKFNGQNSVCTASSASVNAYNPSNIMCVGGDNNLGVELDLNYRYTTLDKVTFGFDAGYWFVGSAWDTYKTTQNSNYGMRASIETQF